MFDESFINKIEPCEFCGMNMDIWDEHRPECPVNFVSEDNFKLIRENEKELYHQFIENGELAQNIGLQILLAIDLVMSSQKVWQNKSLMSKFDELLNKYSDLTDFIVALHQAGVLTTVEEVIWFLKDPGEFDELFAIWCEQGQPKEEESTWLFFINSVHSNSEWKKNKPS